MNDLKKLGFALGLAQKAGKVASGDYAVKAAIKSGKVRLLLIAEDAAENSKKDLKYLADVYKVRVKEALTRVELGLAIGKAQRTALAIVDSNFAEMINKGFIKE
ncbi:MAG TPA: ribosomal L7Ae/L30e/S12e/Gadd45 family protein [Candidatus Avacidaminococcus intestinavium]|uniref:Ribosomal L7Ae/L30e/S12e/Gadd45 family protein n=1 Tax=Candidatus Avacidaminococcus intestinavium TaxID=2840684 RepID=A0A9D1MRR4_9FIRM|nr:ribosomal L7Ae/L30e/S12e/Gadd45 family protein [Candidatus Avacidaminococcus intestinavium]